MERRKEGGNEAAAHTGADPGVRFFLERERRIRDRALFDLAIEASFAAATWARSGSGIWLPDREFGPARSSCSRRQVVHTVGDYAFPSRVNDAQHMSTRQYARPVDAWVTAIGLRPEEYATYSLRRTEASVIFKATGNLRAIQILLGHSKIENTVRYLGLDVEDALLLAERTEI